MNDTPTTADRAREPELWSTGITLTHQRGAWAAQVNIYGGGRKRQTIAVGDVEDLDDILYRVGHQMSDLGAMWTPNMTPGLYVPGDGEEPGLLVGWPANWRRLLTEAAANHGLELIAADPEKS